MRGPGRGRLRAVARPGSPYLAGAPLLIAHRGGSALAPENTLLAFRQALEWWRADVLELDVQPTRDGEVVVIHDPTLDRTTDGTGPVAARTFAELRALDAGGWKSPLFAGERKPEAILQLTQRRRTCLVLRRLRFARH